MRALRDMSIVRYAWFNVIVGLVTLVLVAVYCGISATERDWGGVGASIAMGILCTAAVLRGMNHLLERKG